MKRWKMAKKKEQINFTPFTRTFKAQAQQTPQSSSMKWPTVKKPDDGVTKIVDTLMQSGKMDITNRKKNFDLHGLKNLKGGG